MNELRVYFETNWQWNTIILHVFSRTHALNIVDGKPTMVKRPEIPQEKVEGFIEIPEEVMEALSDAFLKRAAESGKIEQYNVSKGKIERLENEIKYLREYLDKVVNKALQ